jgi:hypothetical protein
MEIGAALDPVESRTLFRRSHWQAPWPESRSRSSYSRAMFMISGLVPKYNSSADRFEVDGANAARTFLEQRGIRTSDRDHVWTAITVHTTPGISQYMHPIAAFVTAGGEMDVLGSPASPTLQETS